MAKQDPWSEARRRGLAPSAMRSRTGKKAAAPAAKKTTAPAYTTKAEPRGSAGLEVNPSTGSTSKRGPAPKPVQKRVGPTRAVTNKATGEVIRARTGSAQPPPANTKRVSKRAAGARSAKGSSFQTTAEKAADPQNWANIAEDLGNAGDVRFRSHRTGKKPNETTRKYMQSTGRSRGARNQKAK